MSRHFRAAMVGSLLVLSMAPGGFCLRRALAQDKGQVQDRGRLEDDAGAVNDPIAKARGLCKG